MKQGGIGWVSETGWDWVGEDGTGWGWVGEDGPGWD